jgi:hypothetical protein
MIHIRKVLSSNLSQETDYPDKSGLLGFWTSSIIRYSKKHNVSKTESVSVLR